MLSRGKLHKSDIRLPLDAMGLNQALDIEKMSKASTRQMGGRDSNLVNTEITQDSSMSTVMCFSNHQPLVFQISRFAFIVQSKPARSIKHIV